MHSHEIYIVLPQEKMKNIDEYIPATISPWTFVIQNNTYNTFCI